MSPDARSDELRKDYAVAYAAAAAAGFEADPPFPLYCPTDRSWWDSAGGVGLGWRVASLVLQVGLSMELSRRCTATK